MSIIRLFITIQFFILSNNCIFASHVFSPIEYGLYEAKTGKDRFWVLYNTHIAALESNSEVSYKGIKSIDIEIPENAKSIPLTDITDFGGATIIVTNNSRDIFLFEKKETPQIVNVKPKEIDTGDFSTNPQLMKGLYLLSITDKKMWVNNRQGYNYGHVRKDLLYIVNGHSINAPISRYDNMESEHEASIVKCSSSNKEIKNVIFFRAINNRHQVYFLNLTYQNNVHIKGVKLHTPINKSNADRIISVSDSYNIRFSDILVDNTYSQIDLYGYGICLNNVSSVYFSKLEGNAAWGIFGNNNVNEVHLSDCDINRFDIHCYGKDIFATNCKFRNLYNQFSSIYGTISYRNCEFYNFTPVLFERSYNAYTKFNLIIRNCTIQACKDKNYLISAGDLNGGFTGQRQELNKQEFPNIDIDGLLIKMPNNLDKYYLYKLKGNCQKETIKEIPGIIKVNRINFLPYKDKQLNYYFLTSTSNKPLTALTILWICFCCFFFSLNKRNRNICN